MLTQSHPHPHAPEAQRTLGATLHRLWTHTGTRIAAATGATVTTALLAAVLMPRGPVTATQALVLMALGLFTGVAVGFILRSRWAMLIAPVVFVLAFELGRIGEVGPTVDTPNLASTFGVIPFLAGRGVTFALALLPMLLGVSWGAAMSRRIAGRANRYRGVRRGIGWLPTALILATVISLLTPAGVPALVDRRGEPVDGGITELTRITLGGTPQWIEIRATSPDLPVLLYLPPVPGLGTLPSSREMLEPLTASFVVVLWDMRGSGKSYASFDPDTLTVDQLVDDTVELTNYLRDRFNEEKIYLVAEWWGTLFSVLAAQQHPELYHAIVNSDQMVAPAEWDRLMYEILLRWASSWEPDEEIARDLIALGPPPYDDIRTYQQLTMDFSSNVVAAGFMTSGASVPPGCYWYPGSAWFGWASFGLNGPEYTLVDRVNALRSRSDVLAVLYPQLREIDLRVTVTHLEVPVFVLDVVQSYTPDLIFGLPLPGTVDLSKAWFDTLDAPYKLWGKGLLVLEPDRLLRFMERTVLPETYPAP